MAMTKHLFEVLITEKKWKPYIKSHYMIINGNKGKSGVILTFENHTTFEYKCSNKTANELLNLYKGL